KNSMYMKKKYYKLIAVLVIMLMGCTISGKAQGNEVIEIYKLIEQKNFFKAREYYKQKSEDISIEYNLLIEATLDNAFNNLEASERKIEKLIKQSSTIPDSLMLQL